MKPADVVYTLMCRFGTGIVISAFAEGLHKMGLMLQDQHLINIANVITDICTNSAKYKYVRLNDE